MTKFKKQLLAVLILVLLLAGLGGTYILLSKEEPIDSPVVVQKGPFGETMKNGRPFIVDEIENEVMNSIKVHNTQDEYSLIHKRSGAYKIEGIDDYEINQTLLSQLRVNTMHLLALDHVETAELDALDQYGINLSDPAVWFEVTYNNEKDSYKIIVGDKTPDNTGYYAMLEGREALYIIDTGIESCVLQPRLSYVTPTIVDTIETNQAYLLKDFELKKKGELFIAIEKVTGDLTYGNNSTHRLTYPAYNYATNMSYFEGLLSALTTLSGTQTLYYGESITPELLSELGFFDAEGNDVADYSIKYSYPAFSEYLYVMKDEEAGGYIVYSLKENIIVSVAEASLPFLDWDMLVWVSSEIYMLDIEDIATLEFEYKDKKAAFNITGTGAELAASSNNVPVDTKAFKEMYKSILYVIVTAYAENSDHGDEQLRLVITTEKGEVLDYRFYACTATNSYYTLNGFGEFYVSADKVLALRDTAFGLAN